MATTSVTKSNHDKHMIVTSFLHVQIAFAVGWMVVAGINSAVVSALIAGAFGMMNVVLLFYLESQHRKRVDDLSERESQLKSRDYEERKREHDES